MPNQIKPVAGIVTALKFSRLISFVKNRKGCSFSGVPDGEKSVERAFTLLEVIVALAILSIALITLFGAQSGSLSLATKAKFNTTASLLAQMKIAELESGELAIADGQGDFGDDFPGYVWKIEIRDITGNLPGLNAMLQGAMRRVELTIAWENTAYRYKTRYYIKVGD